MANYSIEQDIIDNLISDIQKITTANAWPIDLDSSWVSDNPHHFENTNNPYYILVYPVSSGPHDETGHRTKNIFNWLVKIIVRPGSDSSKDRFTLAACVRDKIMEDPRRNELAALTVLDETTYYMAMDDEGASFHVADIEGHCQIHQSVTNYRGT